MVRKTRSRRCVTQEGVKKHKISSKSVQRNIFERIPKKYKIYLYKCSRYFFKLFLHICCKLSFVQFFTDGQGNVTIGKTRWELVAHYSVIVLQIVRTLIILVIPASRVLSGNLDFTTFSCIASLLPFSVGFLYSASILLKSNETAQLINVSPMILSFYEKNSVEVKTMFHNTKNAVFIIVNVLIVSSAVILVPAFGFLVDQLPASLYFIADCIFGQPEFIPNFTWKLLFWPLELLMYGHIMTVTGFNGMLFLTIPNIILTCTTEIRKIRVNTAESWMELRRNYYLLQVYSCLCNSWVKFMIVPTIFIVSFTIVIASYITFRHTEINIFIYLGVACIALSLLVLLFWVCFEVLNLMKTSETIVATLTSRDHLYFLDIPPTQRLYLIKYGKATRPLVFDIGDFMDYSMDVPIGIWDEILNQLLFMLTF